MRVTAMIELHITDLPTATALARPGVIGPLVRRARGTWETPAGLQVDSFAGSVPVASSTRRQLLACRVASSANVVTPGGTQLVRQLFVSTDRFLAPDQDTIATSTFLEGEEEGAFATWDPAE